MAKKGMYISINGYDADTHVVTHSVRARAMREYAKRSLKLVDGPESAARSRASRISDLGEREGVWYVVPDTRECKDTRWKGWGCTSHVIPAEEVRKFCVDELGMTEAPVQTVEVRVEVPVEVPLSLSFEERDILAVALRREQHVANELLRRAYAADARDEAMLFAGRVEGVLALMARLGIEPDDWANGPVWLVEAGIAHRSEVNVEPQLHIFEQEGT